MWWRNDVYNTQNDIAPCEQEEHDSLMACWGAARHGIWAQLDDEQHKPKDTEEHWDGKLVPQRDSHSQESVQLNHLRDRKPGTRWDQIRGREVWTHSMSLQTNKHKHLKPLQTNRIPYKKKRKKYFKIRAPPAAAALSRQPLRGDMAERDVRGGIRWFLLQSVPWRTCWLLTGWREEQRRVWPAGGACEQKTTTPFWSSSGRHTACWE